MFLYHIYIIQDERTEVISPHITRHGSIRQKSIVGNNFLSLFTPLTTAAEKQVGVNKELRRLREKDYLGEIALLQNIARTSNVVANGPVEV